MHRLNMQTVYHIPYKDRRQDVAHPFMKLTTSNGISRTHFTILTSFVVAICFFICDLGPRLPVSLIMIHSFAHTVETAQEVIGSNAWTLSPLPPIVGFLVYVGDKIISVLGLGDEHGLSMVQSSSRKHVAGPYQIYTDSHLPFPKHKQDINNRC